MFTFQNRTIRKVGVVGSGSIGPDIALFLTKVFAPHDVPVVVVDVKQEALDKGRARLQKKVEKGVTSGAFKADQAERMLSNLTFTTDYNQLTGADLVIEAATEDLALKRRIFQQLRALCSNECILLSNSSHLEPFAIFEDVHGSHLCGVLHWFYPAERNLALELVAGDMDESIADWLLCLWEYLGKVPFRVRSAFGYAADAIFEGIGVAACRLLDEGYSAREVEWVNREALGATVGVLTAFNLTNGGPLTLGALPAYGRDVHPWYQVPEALKRQVESGQPFDVPGPGETVAVEAERAASIRRALQGAYLCLASHVLENELIGPDGLEQLLSLALQMEGPTALMRRLGAKEALTIAAEYSEATGAPPPTYLTQTLPLSGEPAVYPFRVQQTDDGVYIVRLSDPGTNNALNWAVYSALERVALEVRNDPDIQALVITGVGTKAFSAGANVGDLSAVVGKPNDAMRRSQTAQRVGLAIEALWREANKPVVIALNGLALGGGFELALCGQVRIATPEALMGLPEVTLGLFPGAGGTQRLPRLIGLERAATLIRTGTRIRADEALDLGVVSKLIGWDGLVNEAVRIAHLLANGGELGSARVVATEALSAIPPLPSIDPAPVPLSRAVDALLCRVLTEGARLPLNDALQVEHRAWGDLVELHDFRIGTAAFLAKPREKPQFTHA